MVAYALQPNQVTLLGFPLKIQTPTILRQKNKKIKSCCISTFRGSLVSLPEIAINIISVGKKVNKMH